MGDLSRRERKLANETLRTRERMKQHEGTMTQDPHTSYKRKTVYTHMPWPLELVLMGRSDVLLLIIIAIVLVTAGLICVFYFGINWVIKAVGWLWPW
jgi:hypothetical protein